MLPLISPDGTKLAREEPQQQQQQQQQQQRRQSRAASTTHGRSKSNNSNNVNNNNDPPHHSSRSISGGENRSSSNSTSGRSPPPPTTTSGTRRRHEERKLQRQQRHQIMRQPQEPPSPQQFQQQIQQQYQQYQIQQQKYQQQKQHQLQQQHEYQKQQQPQESSCNKEHKRTKSQDPMGLDASAYFAQLAASADADEESDNSDNSSDNNNNNINPAAAIANPATATTKPTMKFPMGMPLHGGGGTSGSSSRQQQQQQQQHRRNKSIDPPAIDASDLFAKLAMAEPSLSSSYSMDGSLQHHDTNNAAAAVLLDKNNNYYDNVGGGGGETTQKITTKETKATTKATKTKNNNSHSNSIMGVLSRFKPKSRKLEDINQTATTVPTAGTAGNTTTMDSSYRNTNAANTITRYNNNASNTTASKKYTTTKSIVDPYDLVYNDDDDDDGNMDDELYFGQHAPLDVSNRSGGGGNNDGIVDMVNMFSSLDGSNRSGGGDYGSGVAVRRGSGTIVKNNHHGNMNTYSNSNDALDGSHPSGSGGRSGNHALDGRLDGRLDGSHRSASSRSSLRSSRTGGIMKKTPSTPSMRHSTTGVGVVMGGQYTPKRGTTTTTSSSSGGGGGGGGRNYGRDHLKPSTQPMLHHAYSMGTATTATTTPAQVGNANSERGEGGAHDDDIARSIVNHRNTIGTFTIPTFKDDDGPAPRSRGSGRRENASSTTRGSGRYRPSVSRGSSTSAMNTNANGYKRGGISEAGIMVKPGSSRRISSNKPFSGDFTDEDSDDDWMTDALLNGITNANKLSGDIVKELASLETYLGGEGSGGGNNAAPSSSSAAASVESSKSNSRGGRITTGGGSQSSSSRRSRTAKYRKSKSTDATATTDLESYQQSSMANRSDSSMSFNPEERRNYDQRATVVLPIHADSKKFRRKNTSESEPRRCSVGDLMDPQMALDFLMNTSNHNSDELKKKKTPPPTSALSNIPVLPTIKTYKVSKQRPDEPAGLFLTKAKHGAVLVHSLSPESLFHRTAMQPGQEVLSVNEKRVNDPKMAATLITQAKGELALRVSSTERPRGFQYCQVKRKRGPGDHTSVGATPHGIRFVTTGIDGVQRRNQITEGIVRVSQIDADGLFANSQPMNRLRVGSIVLTVNGLPVTNGRSALEKVMDSQNLVEVLHCDDRVWRDDWVKDGLDQVLSGTERDHREMASSIFGKKDALHIENALSSSDGEKLKEWSTDWQSGRGEVILRKIDKGYGFKLKFSEDVGTCHAESVENESMPPADEFDVSLLVDKVNDSHRTMMQILQNMLQRAKFESKLGSSSTSRRSAAGSKLMSAPRNRASSRRVAPNNDPPEFQRRPRNNSIDGLTLLFEDEDSANEDLSALANSLLRADDRDRPKRQPQDTGRKTMNLPMPDKDPEGRRNSTGIMNHLNFSPEEVEFLRMHNFGAKEGPDKIREYSARRKKTEERYNRSYAAEEYAGRQYSSNSVSMSSCASSMFSADVLEDFVSVSYTPTLSVSTNGTTSQDEAPPSPRQDEHRMDPGILISPNNNKKESLYSAADEKNVDDEKAYITGVVRDVKSKYDISSTIVGSGGFGEVRECVDKKTGQVHVVKTILKPAQHDTTKINLIRNEILLLHEANHPNIVDLKDLFEDDEYVHIVMERCTGGDLFDRVVNENPRRLRSRTDSLKHESRTANAMRSILNVLKYLHSKGIVHRDIKPEHFLLTTSKRDTQKIKLIDFGLARKHKPGSTPMTTFTGSPSFVAPEVIARSYDHMCDMFSTGVTAYFLLTGMLPFDGPTDEDTFHLISIGKFKFPSSSSVYLSDDAKDFITKLLKVDPRARMSAEGALKHPWMLKAASC